MTLSIRAVYPHERTTIACMHRTSATAAYANMFQSAAPFLWVEVLERWDTFAGEILVAENERNVITGFVAFDEHELHALYVLPEHWGHGVGGALLEAAGDVSALWVLEANIRGRRFYEMRGWTADGTSRQEKGVCELRYPRTAARA